MDGFSTLAREQLGWYVYLLRDPRDGRVFYVGKGKGNRAFAHEASAASAEDHPGLQSAKAARIAAIAGDGKRVQVDVLRHGIASEPQAYEVESAAIDVVNLLAPGTLLNVVMGHHHVQRGLMPSQEIEVLYAAQPAPALEVPVMLVSLNNRWDPNLSEQELEEATAYWWHARGPRRAKCQYVFGVHNGVVRTVYRPLSWRPRVQGDHGWEEDVGKTYARWGFEPAPAPEMAHYLRTIGAAVHPSHPMELPLREPRGVNSGHEVPSHSRRSYGSPGQTGEVASRCRLSEVECCPP